MFVFVEGTGHLSLKLMMRQESWCQTALTVWQSAKQHVCDCGWKSERVCTLVKSEWAFPACGVCQHVRSTVSCQEESHTNPVEHKATRGVIDMRSYFMGAAHACRWAPSQFTSFTGDCFDALALPLLSRAEGREKKGKERREKEIRAADSVYLRE